MTTATANSPRQPIRVHSAPDEAWFETEVEAITEGLLTESASEAEPAALGSRTHALAVWLVRTVARRGEPFTVEDLYRVVERGNVPMPQGTTRADIEPLLRRLEPDDERFSAARVGTGGQP